MKGVYIDGYQSQRKQLLLGCSSISSTCALSCNVVSGWLSKGPRTSELRSTKEDNVTRLRIGAMSIHVYSGYDRDAWNSSTSQVRSLFGLVVDRIP